MYWNGYPPPPFYPPPQSGGNNDPAATWIKFMKYQERQAALKEKKEEENRLKESSKGSKWSEKQFNWLHVFLFLTALFPIIGPLYIKVVFSSWAGLKETLSILLK